MAFLLVIGPKTYGDRRRLPVLLINKDNPDKVGDNMPEEVVQGYSLEEIREDWAGRLRLLPEDLTLEVMEKPSFFSRHWKVRLLWKENILQDPLLTPSQADWDGTKYVVSLGEGVKLFRPFKQAGEVWLNGKHQDKPFRMSLGDQVEFHPLVKAGKLTWE